jgi:hypothetical protein
MGFLGLYRAAASFAAMFEGDGVRSPMLSSGTPRVLELLDWGRSCMGDACGLPTLLALPPVTSCLKGDAVPAVVLRVGPVPALVAARSAPLPPPVYVFVCGFGFTGGFEKAMDAPWRAASRTLYWVSPVTFGTWGVRAELLIEYPSERRGRRGRQVVDGRKAHVGAKRRGQGINKGQGERVTGKM